MGYIDSHATLIKSPIKSCFVFRKTAKDKGRTSQQESRSKSSKGGTKVVSVPIIIQVTHMAQSSELQTK
jgi:hypothetical protein